MIIGDKIPDEKRSKSGEPGRPPIERSFFDKLEIMKENLKYKNWTNFIKFLAEEYKNSYKYINKKEIIDELLYSRSAELEKIIEEIIERKKEELLKIDE